MGKMRLGRLGLSLLAAAAVAPTTPAPVAPSHQQIAPATQPKSTKAPVTPAVNAAQFVVQNYAGFDIATERKHRIWQGVEKRGNRKGRSRFNYNR